MLRAVLKLRSLSFLILIVTCTWIFAEPANAQLNVQTSVVVSSSSTTPFWFQSNRFGHFSGEGTQFLTRIYYDDIIESDGPFTLLYGADLIARPGRESTASFNRGYLKLQAYGFELAAGRFVQISPGYPSGLGMGSLGISRNVTPIPKVSFAVPTYLPVPFTKEFIKFRGHLIHGWLGSERFTEDVLLHEKVGYLKFGGNLPVNLYAGLAHYTKWGGNNHPRQGDIPKRFSDYWNVFFVMGGDEFTPGQEQTYALGDHLGVWDFGADLELGDTNIKLYRQFPIETKFNLKLQSAQDALTGILIELPDDNSSFLRSFIYEYMYTKYQAGPRRPNVGGDLSVDLYRGNQNYYNHGLYRTGWVYNFRTIGNPLFKPVDSNLGIINNRIIAHHVGFEALSRGVTLTGKATYSRNFGKRCDNRVPDLGEEELFGIQCENVVETSNGRELKQISLLASAEAPARFLGRDDLFLKVELAFDNGLLFGDQFGVMTSLRWSPN